MAKRPVQNKRYPDLVFLFFTLVLVFFGLIMVFSAATTESLRAGDPFYYFKKQLIYIAIGIVAMLFASRVDYKKYRDWVVYILGASIILLLSVFIPFLSHSAGGASRWIDLGFISFQPSEFAKLGVIIYLADAITRKGEMIKDFFKGIMPLLAVVLVVCAIIMKQPDLGTVLVIFGAALIMLYLASAQTSHLTWIFAASAVSVFILSKISPYRWKRIVAFIDPWKDPKGIGFHIIQSWIAIGSGGIFGYGLGNSRQKYLYLPEQYTDFIFAVVCEELGLIGAAGVVLLFLAFVSRGLRICRRAPDRFSYLLSGGLISYMGLQAVLNIGVVVGLFPTTGIPLPFISYGGTSLIVLLYSAGILLNISAQSGDK